MQFLTFPSRRRLAWSLGGAFIALSVAVPAEAAPDRMAPDLAARIHANPDDSTPTRVIVQFSEAEADAGAVAQAHRGQVLARHGLINGATLTLPRKAVAALSR